MSYSDLEREDIIKRICGLIIQTSVEDACKQVGIAESTFYAWMASDDELSEDYTRARKAIAFKDENAIEKTVTDVENGRIDPAAAKAAIDGRKWLAGRRHPKVFGDKQIVEATNKNTNLNVDVRLDDVPDDKIIAARALLFGKGSSDA